MVMVMVLTFLQIVAIVIHGIVLANYRRYCKHCDWWSDIGCLIFFIATFIPIGGIILCMAGPIDYMRNLAEALEEERNKLLIL